MYSAPASAASYSGLPSRASTSSNPAGAISRAISPASAEGGTTTILGLMRFLRDGKLRRLAGSVARADSHVAGLQDRLTTRLWTMPWPARDAGRDRAQHPMREA